MNLMQGYEVVEVLEPEVLSEMPDDEKYDSYTVYNLSFNATLPPEHPDYFLYKSADAEEVLLVKYPQSNNYSHTKRGLQENSSSLIVEDESLLNIKKNKNQTVSLHSHHSLSHPLEDHLDKYDKEVRNITNRTPSPDYVPIKTPTPTYKTVRGNLVREDNSGWVDQQNVPTYPNSYTQNQNHAQSPPTFINYSYNGYPYQQQPQQPNPAQHLQPYPANYGYQQQLAHQGHPPTATEASYPNAREQHQPRKVSFETNEHHSKLNNNDIYKRVERHLNATIDKYEYNVAPIVPNRARTAEELNMEKLDELKRVLNYYPYLIKEAKVVTSGSRLHNNVEEEEELQIGYHDHRNEHMDDHKVQVYKLSDLIMRSKSNSNDKLNEQMHKSTQYDDANKSHETTHQATQSDEVNREALDVFRKVDELVKLANKQSDEAKGLPGHTLEKEPVSQMNLQEDAIPENPTLVQLSAVHLTQEVITTGEVSHKDEVTKVILDGIINQIEQEIHAEIPGAHSEAEKNPIQHYSQYYC